MFYAMYCPYGVNTMSRSDRLLRFATKVERDDWCEGVFGEMHGYRSTYNREAVNREQARFWFPTAFGATSASDLWQKSFDGIGETWTGAPTGGGYFYMR